MIAASSSYALLLFAAWHLRQRKMWLEFAIVLVPILYCGYFGLSIFVFSFGEFMPFTYYRAALKPVYGQVSAMISLHFLVVVLALLSVRAFDHRPYKRMQSISLRAFSVGPFGALFCMLPVLFVLLATPLSELWDRPSFIVETDNGHWMRFADLLLFISAIMTPFIKSVPLKLFVLFSVSLAFLLIGSRSGVVMLLIFATIEFFIVRRHRKWFPIMISILGIWMLAIILYLRWDGGGGLLAILRTLFGGDPELLTSAVGYGVNYLFNLSFVLIGEMFVSVEAEARWFTYSILPLPSAFLDQTAAYDAHSRFRNNIPYSGFGYAIIFLGPTIYLLVVYLSALSFLSARWVLSTRRDLLEGILCVAFFVIPFLVLMQYNLRTGSRLIYVFAVLYFAVALGRRMRFKPRQ
ncbi:MAG: hypothetical protein RIA08_16070 [Roseovarius sp.]|uniref:hypothetical protein n=1 Tax=Roseovarius sp. TaxID=1486281 RepID=UPI0032F000E6